MVVLLLSCPAPTAWRAEPGKLKISRNLCVLYIFPMPNDCRCSNAQMQRQGQEGPVPWESCPMVGVFKILTRRRRKVTEVTMVWKAWTNLMRVMAKKANM